MNEKIAKKKQQIFVKLMELQLEAAKADDMVTYDRAIKAIVILTGRPDQRSPA